MIIIMCNYSMQIRLGKLNVNYCVCVCQGQELDQIREFYQAFNICAVQVSLLKGLLTTFKYVVKVMHYMKMSLLELVYITSLCVYSLTRVDLDSHKRREG